MKDWRKYGNSSMDRQVAVYPKQKYYELVVADAKDQESSKSEIASSILKKHYDSLPESTRARLRSIYESMTEEEKRFPRKI